VVESTTRKGRVEAPYYDMSFVEQPCSKTAGIAKLIEYGAEIGE
jgi:hypothetical protein